jgi:serine/threonine protein phosphatase 1
MHNSADRTLPSRFKLRTNIRCYAIGDIHGRLDLLDQINLKIERDLISRPCHHHLRIFLGDYIDRGPESCAALDRLIELKKTTESVFIKGNHETFIGEFIENPSILPSWRSLGGLETIASYGLKTQLNPDPEQQQRLAEQFSAALPPAHLQFIRELKPYYLLDDIFFVHAGVRPGVRLADQQQSDMMWIREEFLHHDGLFEKLIVHGHTPVRAPEIRPNRINLDTGAYITGQLTCIWIEEDRFGFL